jgi:hypothetical protein
VLGVSVREFDDHTAAAQEVELVREHVTEANFDVEHVPGGQWWWKMRPVSTGPDLAVSSHGFARRVDAALSSRRFRQRAPWADIEFTVVVFEQGRRGREVPFEQRFGGATTAEQPSRGAADMWPQHPIC